LWLLLWRRGGYEEYVYPGYFPGQFNRGVFNSDSPRNYPLNAQTAMVINVFGAVVPNLVMRDRNSPYAFTAKQMGRYDVSFSNFCDKAVAKVWVSPGQRADT
jgi:hypothetical protein